MRKTASQRTYVTYFTDFEEEGVLVVNASCARSARATFLKSRLAKRVAQLYPNGKAPVTVREPGGREIADLNLETEAKA